MLLRRITKHVTEQNWFAVFIDFIIVVVGVFIGIQVANWNDQSKVSADERNFLERLNADILELQERRAGYEKSRPIIVELNKIYAEYLYEQRNSLDDAIPFILDLTPGLSSKQQELIDSLICGIADYSNALTLPPSSLPTAVELISAGRINDISSESIKSKLQSYIQQVNRAQDYIKVADSETIDLNDEFPELIATRMHNWNFKFNGVIPLKHTCNYQAMRSNTAFLSAHAKNSNNYEHYTVNGIFPVSEKLSRLREAVESELGIPDETTAKEKQ